MCVCVLAWQAAKPSGGSRPSSRAAQSGGNKPPSKAKLALGFEQAHGLGLGLGSGLANPNPNPHPNPNPNQVCALLGLASAAVPRVRLFVRRPIQLAQWAGAQWDGAKWVGGGST